MRRPARALAALAGLLVFSTGAVPAAGGAATAPASKYPAVERLASCVRDNHRLLALFLIDESGSLRQTDPSQERVKGLKVAFEELEQVRTTPIDGIRPRVDVYLAGFSVGFDTLAGWASLQDGVLPRLERQAEAYAARNDGLDTDYEAAFLGAHEVLGRRSAELTRDGSTSPCKAVFWFTDGKYDIEDRNGTTGARFGTSKPYAPEIRLDQPGGGARLTARGRELLCEKNGLLDQLRTADVVTVAVALTTQIAQEDQAFLQSVATGSGCGSPPEQPVGALVRAADVADLVLAFDSVFQAARDGTPGPSESMAVCPKAACPRGTLQFVVDPGLRRFHVLALTGGDGIVVELRGPGSTGPLRFVPSRPGSGRLGSARVGHSWVAPNALVADADLPRDTSDWAGKWSVTFIDPSGSNPDAVARAQIHLFGDLVPRLVGAPKLTRGEESAFDVELVDAAGTPTTPKALFQTLSVGATVTEPDGGSGESVALTGPDSAGHYHGRYRVAPERRSSSANLTLRVDTTTRSGIALTPVVKTYSVPVLPPSSYPTVSPAVLRFPSITDKRSTEMPLTVVGGKGGGCVWVESSRFAVVPASVRSVEVAADPGAHSRSTCLKVGAGERRVLRLTAKPGRNGFGQVKGTVTLRLQADGNDRVLSLDLPASFDILNVPIARKLFLVLLVAGITLPFLVVWLAKYLTAKFQPTGTLRFASFPVHVRGQQLVRPGRDGEDHGKPLLPFDPTEFQPVPGDRAKRRSWELARVRFTAHAGIRPFSPPTGAASSDGLRILGAGRPSAAGRAIEVPLALEKTWLFLVDEVAFEQSEDKNAGQQVATARGRFLGLIRIGRGAQQLHELEPSVRDVLPGRVRELAEADASSAAATRGARPGADEQAPRAQDDPGSPQAPPPRSGRGRSREVPVPPSRQNQPEDRPGDPPTDEPPPVRYRRR